MNIQNIIEESNSLYAKFKDIFHANGVSATDAVTLARSFSNKITINSKVFDYAHRTRKINVRTYFKSPNMVEEKMVEYGFATTDSRYNLRLTNSGIDLFFFLGMAVKKHA